MSNALAAGIETLEPYFATSDSLIAAKARGLLMGYDKRWANAPYLIDSVESIMSSDLFNPETGRKSRSFVMAGKLDLRVTEIATGSKGIIDHKTASQEIDDPNAPYWRQLQIEGQVSHYMLLEWLNQNKVDFGVWDVIRKPSISPRQIAKKDRELIRTERQWYGFECDDIELEEMDRTERENATLYMKRLAFDCTEERPGWYFQRRKIARLDAEIHEYGIELWGHAQDILATRNSGRHPRNSGACFNYSSPCKFLGVCSGHDSLDSGAWTKKPWVHNELPILNHGGIVTDGRGTEVLTNSRIRCFQTCRQKHYFEYELGVQKVDEEEKESLFFGTMFHTALEQYFLTLQKEQQANPTTA